jgi:hypothetical protein
MEGKKNFFIDDDQGCKATGAMTPQELLKHLTNQADYTRTAISVGMFDCWLQGIQPCE